MFRKRFRNYKGPRSFNGPAIEHNYACQRFDICFRRACLIYFYQIVRQYEAYVGNSIVLRGKIVEPSLIIVIALGGCCY